MKTSGLQKFAWVFFALVLTTTSVFSQAWRNNYRINQNQNGNCLSQISDLSDKQQKQIIEMEDKHQKTMAELRENRRDTRNAIEKNEIKGEMLKKVEDHKKAVKGILNKDQQNQYDQLHAYGRNQNSGNNGGYANFRGKGNNHGNQNFARGNRNNKRNWNSGQGRNNRFNGQNNCINQGNSNFGGRGSNRMMSRQMRD